MGMMFRPRRPLMRVAAGAATATVAYKAGQRRTQQNQYNDQAQADQRTDAVRAPAGRGGARRTGTGGLDGRAGAVGQAARVGRAERRGVRGGEGEAARAVSRSCAGKGRRDGIKC